MGDVSVDVFTIPMVEFDCLGGPKLKWGCETLELFLQKVIKRYFTIYFLKVIGSAKSELISNL